MTLLVAAVAGALLGATGSTDVVLWFLAGTGLVMAVSGYCAALPRMVDDETSA